MDAYLAQLAPLGLDDYQLFNAQGNSFDRTAVAIRVQEAVDAWLSGAPLSRRQYPTPSQARDGFCTLSRRAGAVGVASLPLALPSWSLYQPSSMGRARPLEVYPLRPKTA
ncbi:MAG: hypothetical protein ACKPKO_46525, partial [Candidatus Fonsibacter sp.]